MYRTIKEILKYCTTKQKFKFIFFSTLASILETFSIAVIFTLATLYFDGSKNFEILGYLIDFDNLGIDKIIIFLVFLIIFKTIYLNYFSWWRNNFVFNFNLLISKKIYEAYLNKGYQYHLNKNSSEFVRNTFNESRTFSNILDSVLKLFTDILIIFFIISLLLFFNFEITFISLAIILIFFLIFVYFSKNYFTLLGKEKLYYLKYVFKFIREGYDNIREIKVFNLKNYFINNFSENLKKVNDSTVTANFLSDIPKNSIELFIIIILFFGFFIIKKINYIFDLNNLIVIIVSYGFASLKLLPSSLRMINYINQITNATASIKVINELLTSKNKFNKKKTKNFFVKKKNVIKIKNLHFSYNKESNLKFTNVNLTLKSGEIIFVKGESGAGKSTFINLIAGLLMPIKGKIEFNNMDIHENIEEWFKNISYISQNSKLIDDTVLNNIILNSKKDFKLLNKVLGLANANKFTNILKKKTNFVVGEDGSKLSGGQIQRIIFSRALYKKPKILILDEFTSALDEHNEKSILKSLKLIKKDCIILISSHNNFLESLSDKILEITIDKKKSKKISIVSN